MTEKISSKKEKLLKGVALMGIATAALAGCKAEGTEPTTPSSEVTQTQTEAPEVPTPTATETAPAPETTLVPEETPTPTTAPTSERMTTPFEPDSPMEAAEIEAAGELVEKKEFKLTDSEIYNNLSEKDRAKVDYAMKASVEEFNSTDREIGYYERSLFGLVAMDAVADDFIKYYEKAIIEDTESTYGDVVDEKGQHHNLARLSCEQRVLIR